MKKHLKFLLSLTMSVLLATSMVLPVCADNTSINMDGNSSEESSSNIPVTADISGTEVISYTITAPATIPLSKQGNGSYASGEYNITVSGLLDTVTIKCVSTNVNDSGNSVTLTKDGAATTSKNGTFYLAKTSDGSGTTVTLDTDAERLTAMETGYTLYGKISGVEGLTYGTWTGGIKFVATQN